MNSIYKIWSEKQPHKLKGTDLEINGFSIAAFRTNFYIKKLEVMFDAGISGNMSPDYIFITHCHSDHIANIPFHLISKKDNQKIKVYVPEESVKVLTDYIMSLYIANEHLNKKNITPESWYDTVFEIIGVKAGHEFSLEIKGRKYIIKVIKCYHTVPCVGYGFVEVKQKIKKEYIELGKQIQKLREEGVEVYTTIEKKSFCYIGDTSKEILQEDLDYDTIILECTFIGDDEKDRATETDHIHFDEISNYIKNKSDIDFMLYHFSSRYKGTIIKDFFDSKAIKNIIPWINNGD